MEKPTRSIQWIVWSGLALVLVAIVLAYSASRLGVRVQVGSVERLPLVAKVPGFTLTNQVGQIISLDSLRGQVWIADIIFTRCPGPCAKMSRELSELQSSLSATDPVQLVSLTADPEFDTSEMLKRYGEKFGAVPGRWHFLTGGKAELYALATRGLLLAVDETSPDRRESESDLFVHSTRFVLVDQRGRIRGVYEGTEPESRPQILKAIQSLLAER